MESSERVVFKSSDGPHQTPSRRPSQVARDSGNNDTSVWANKPLTTREALVRLHDDLKTEIDKVKVTLFFHHPTS